MPKRRINATELYAHFVTFGVDRRRKLLKFDPPKRIFLGVLTEQLQQQRARCVGFVLMPEHVHLIVWFPQPGQLSGFMHGLKRKSSFRIRAWYRQHCPASVAASQTRQRFWTPRYYSFEITSAEKLQEKLDYMHLNPVRAGFVARAIDWQWSSARKYVQGRTVGVPIRWPEV